MKPLVDDVSGDRREEATTDDEAGRPDCRGARQGGQRGSSYGRHGRSRPPHWVEMTPKGTSVWTILGTTQRAAVLAKMWTTKCTNRRTIVGTAVRITILEWSEHSWIPRLSL